LKYTLEVGGECRAIDRTERLRHVRGRRETAIYDK